MRSPYSSPKEVPACPAAATPAPGTTRSRACSTLSAPATWTTSNSTSWIPWSIRACSRPTPATSAVSAAAANRSPDSGHRRHQPSEEDLEHARLHQHREQQAVARAPEMGAVVDVVAAAAIHPDRIADVEHRVDDRRHRDEEH